MHHKRLLALLIMILMLTGCFGEDTLTSTFAFPDTQWNMSPDALISALSLGDDVARSDYSDSYAQYHTITVEDFMVFGFPATVTFRFVDVAKDDTYGLHYIVVLYPEETDMNAIRSAISEEYGNPIKFSTTKYDAEYRAHVSRWESEATFYDSLSEEQIRELDDDLLEEYRDSVLANIMWSDEAYRILTGSPDNWDGPPCALTFYCGLAEIPKSNK